MKKIAVVLLLVLVATNVFAGGPIDINGYDWVAFSYDAKMMFTLGVLAGICYANIALLGYAADGITLANVEHVQLIIKALDYSYKDASVRSESVVTAIAVAWNTLRGN